MQEAIDTKVSIVSPAAAVGMLFQSLIVLAKKASFLYVVLQWGTVN